MSDRVWFATTDYRLFSTFTRNVNSSKFSGFPVRVVENDGSSVGVGTRYPIGMTADEAMSLYWRVKLMTVDTDGYLDDTSGDIITLMEAALDTDTATRERDIITTTRGRSGIFGRTWLGLPSTITHTITLFFNDATWPACYKVGATYYPYITLLSQIYVESTPNPSSLYVSLFPSAGSYYGNFSGSFGPHTVTYYWVFDDSIAVPYGITYYNITFDSYWPYAASDGSPIYNTSTGALLQDPRN